MAGIFDQVIFLMVAAAFVVGALVVGLVIYAATIERRGEYGILKAIGARNSALYRVVIYQAVVAASLGVLLGVGFAFAMGWLVMTAKPQFLVAIEPPAILVTLAAGFVMALAGALVPARAVAALAPAGRALMCGSHRKACARCTCLSLPCLPRSWRTSGQCRVLNRRSQFSTPKA